jgi:hypothetical protein
MSQTTTGRGQAHEHGQGCGHTAIRHDGHADYLNHGHLEHVTGGSQVEEHRLSVDATNPDRCTPDHRCDGHGAEHTHNAQCGHPAVPHGDHTDYLVGDHLHHQHGSHCDNHGRVATM